MGIGLMANIPDQLILRRIKHIVKGDGQLDDAKPCAEVATSLTYRVE